MKRAIHHHAALIQSVRSSIINQCVRALQALREIHLQAAHMSVKLIMIVALINIVRATSVTMHAINVERELNVMVSAIIVHNASAPRTISEVHL